MQNLPAMKIQLWLKSKSVSEYISNIICELKIADRIGFKETFLKHRNQMTFPFPTRIKQCCSKQCYSKQCYSISLKI